KTIAPDVNETKILELLDQHPKATLVVSPIGAQGFILGRGNLQVSPAVLRRIGARNEIVVATPGNWRRRRSSASTRAIRSSTRSSCAASTSSSSLDIELRNSIRSKDEQPLLAEE